MQNTIIYIYSGPDQSGIRAPILYMVSNYQG